MVKKRVFIVVTGILLIFVGNVVISSMQRNNTLGITMSFAKGDDSDGGRDGSSNNDDDKSKDEVKVQEKKEKEKKEEVRVKSREGDTRIELRQKTDGDRTRIKQEIRTENGRIKFEVKDGETRVKIETKTGQLEQEFEVSSKSSELAEIESSEEKKFKIKIRVRDGGFELKAKGTTALTNFPLSFNPETNELSVTTPKGAVLIKTLPQVAVQNILASNVMDRVLGQDSDVDEDDIEDIEDEEATEVKVEGFVKSLTASQIAVSGITFTINSATESEKTITVGSGVKVKGNPQNGTLVARKVELEDEVEPKVKIEGAVESFTEDIIIVSGIAFARSPTTRIEGNLALGQQVEIKGAPAAGGVLLANKIDVEASGKGLILAEENGEAVFKIKGQKDARFLNIFPVTLPVEATISVETGKVLSVSNPFLLNILSFLFRT